MSNVDCLKNIDYINTDIEKYEKYINLISKTKVNIGNSNCYIQDNSTINLSKDCVNRLIKIIQACDNKKDKKQSVRYIRESGGLKQKYSNVIIVITLQDSGLKYFMDKVFSYMEDNPTNIYYIINDDKDDISDKFKNLAFWKFTLEPLYEEQKVKYIKDVIKKSGYKVKKYCAYIDVLKKMPFKQINNELVTALLKKFDSKVEDNFLDDSFFEFKKEEKIVKEKVQESKTNSIDKLNNMIGLSNVKLQVKRIRDYIKVNKERNNMPALHIVMRGNPGTGKTMVARILADIFKELDIFKTNNFVEATRETLIGRYVGHTAIKTKEVIDKSLDGVLFIDEAYSLAYSEFKGDFGNECIFTLIKEMEDKRDKLAVIFAGYTKEMNDMLDSNPGFKSRIQFFIDFEDYNANELLEIFKEMVKVDKCELQKECEDILYKHFAGLIEKKDHTFGNARTIRNIFEKIKFIQASRIVDTNDSNYDYIKVEDVVNVIQEESSSFKTTKIGFNVDNKFMIS